MAVTFLPTITQQIRFRIQQPACSKHRVFIHIEDRCYFESCLKDMEEDRRSLFELERLRTITKYLIPDELLKYTTSKYVA
jgi:hypothetical protein